MRVLEKDNPEYRNRLCRTADMMYREEPCAPEEVAAVRCLYAGAVYHVDSLLGTLFDDLKRLGLWDDMMIIITAGSSKRMFRSSTSSPLFTITSPARCGPDNSPVSL